MLSFSTNFIYFDCFCEVVVVFSGFKEKDPHYSFKHRKQLMEQIVKLGGTVFTGEILDSSVTHIVISLSFACSFFLFSIDKIYSCDMFHIDWRSWLLTLYVWMMAGFASWLSNIENIDWPSSRLLVSYPSMDYRFCSWGQICSWK
jgi:hypothetical protein